MLMIRERPPALFQTIYISTANFDARHLSSLTRRTSYVPETPHKGVHRLRTSAEGCTDFAREKAKRSNERKEAAQRSASIGWFRSS